MTHERRFLTGTLLASALAGAALLATWAAPAWSAPKSGAGRAGAGRARAGGSDAAAAQRGARTAKSATGLGSLTDDALLSELAGRKLDVLLERAFEVNNVDPSRRGAMLAFPALETLEREGEKLPTARRLQLVRQGADLGPAMATIKDPVVLMRHAATLVRLGLEPDANTLEYWGDDPNVQKRMRPVAETVARMYDEAGKAAEARKAEIEKDMNRGVKGAAADKIAEKWMQVDLLATTAKYTKHIIDYNRAMSLPRTADGWKQRSAIADEAIKYLSEFNDPESGIPQLGGLRNRIAKLYMAKGDFKAAKEVFATVIDEKQLPKLPDDPDEAAREKAARPGQQYEARYFTIVCELESKNLAEAQKGLAALKEWSKANLGKDKDTREGVEAAEQMMQYRIHKLEQEVFPEPARKAKANEQAIAVLTDLYEKRRDLQGIISEQLLGQLGADVDLKTQKPLILSALIRKGIQERDSSDKPSADVLRQAVAAAREYVVRDDKAIKPDDKEWAALMIPTFIEKMGPAVADRIMAADEFLAFAQKYPKSRFAEASFNQAYSIIDGLLKDENTRGVPQVKDVFERFLAVAIDQFGVKEFAFEYAKRLRLRNEHQKALKYLRMVTDKKNANYLNARFQEMLSLTELLGEKGPDGKLLLPTKTPARQKAVQDIQRLADEVRALASAAIKAAKDEKVRNGERIKLAAVSLTAADLAVREGQDYNRAIQTLEGFDESIKGLPNAATLAQSALKLRIISFIALDQFDKATDALERLIRETGGQEGPQIVRSVLAGLEDDLAEARQKEDAAAMERITGNMARLSGFLVSNEKDPALRYQYSRFDANVKRMAGEYATDNAVKKQRLDEAQAAYLALQKPENVKLYQKTIPAGSKSKDRDPNVLIGLGLTEFARGSIAPDADSAKGHWEKADRLLKELFVTRQLGTPKNAEPALEGGVKLVPNETYWEATYKLFRSAYNWAEADKSNALAQKEREAAETMFKREIVREGWENVGGKRWHTEFDQLAKDMNVDPAKLKQIPTTTQPATDPPATGESSEIASGDAADKSADDDGAGGK